MDRFWRPGASDVIPDYTVDGRLTVMFGQTSVAERKLLLPAHLSSGPPAATPSVRRRVIGWYDRRRSGRAVLEAWIVSRLLVLVVLATLERFVVGDVFYYWRKIEAMFDVGLTKTLNEYPTPVSWLLWLPYAVTGGSRIGYLIAFVALMMALDAAFTFALWRSNGRRHDTSIDFWLVFVLLIGPLSYLRFDILPAVLAGGALLAARRRPWVTGALTGLGAAVKLWPALLMPAFLAYRKDRRAAGLAFVAVGVGLAVVSLVAGGWTRLVSPLTWQSGRGLQIESIWSTPLMVARAVQPQGWIVDMSRYQAYEVFGPGVSALLTVSDLATVVGLVVIVALFARGLRSPQPTATVVGMVILATVAIMTITNKTLSPQYLLWMGGPMAALLQLRRDQPDAQQAETTRLAWQLLGLALLTHLVYPLFYDGLLGRQGTAGIIAATIVVTIRNVALVAFTLHVCRIAWSSLRRTPASG